MGIKKCNTVDAIWLLESRCPDDFGGEVVSNNQFNINVNFHFLSTNDIWCLLNVMKIDDFSGLASKPGRAGDSGMSGARSPQRRIENTANRATITAAIRLTVATAPPDTSHPSPRARSSVWIEYLATNQAVGSSNLSGRAIQPVDGTARARRTLTDCLVRDVSTGFRRPAGFEAPRRAPLEPHLTDRFRTTRSGVRACPSVPSD